MTQRRGWAPASRTTGRGAGLRLLPVALLVALAATWPLALSPTRAVPRGTEATATPTLHDLWTLWWVAESAARGLAGFWDAPIFRPQAGAFAFSDPLLLPGLAAAPLWWSGLPPALCYNAALLAVLALNGACAGRLVLALGGRPPAAAFGAALAAALPYAAKMAGVLTVLPCFGLLLAFEGLVRFSTGGGRRPAWLAGAGWLVQCLTSLQVALLGSPVLALAAAAALAGQPRPARAALRLLPPFAVSAGLALLVLLPLVRAHRDPAFRRPEAVVLAGSARPSDFLRRPPVSRLSVPRRAALDHDANGLFPGFLLLSLAGVGIAGGRHEGRRWRLALAAAAGMSAALALGLNAELGGWKPFASLRAHVFGFAGIRSPFRAALLCQALLAVLAALGVDALLRRARRRAGRAAVLAVATLAVVENLCLPAPLLGLPPQPGTAWTAWLRDQRPSPRAAAHLPFPGADFTAALEPEAWRMFRQIDHGVPLVNGYAASFPPLYDALRRLTNEEFPSYRSLCALSELAGVDTVLVDRPWFESRGSLSGDPAIARILQPAYEDGEVAVFRLRHGPGDCRPSPAPDPGPRGP